MAPVQRRLLLVSVLLASCSITIWYFVIEEQQWPQLKTFISAGKDKRLHETSNSSQDDERFAFENETRDFKNSEFIPSASVNQLSAAKTWGTRKIDTSVRRKTHAKMAQNINNMTSPATSRTVPTRLVPTTPLYGDSSCPENSWRSGLKELLQSWIELCHKHNIQYMLAYGSLLGAVRNGDVIPYDSDLDVLVDKRFYPVLEKLSVKRNFSSGDGIIRLVVQPEFWKFDSETRKRFTCEGKVNVIDILR